MQRYFAGAFLLFSLSAFINTDTYTSFSNPSFESEIRKESMFPSGWSSKSPGNTPDILPGAWELDYTAQHGKTCLGLVTRDDGSSENIGQMLSKPLINGDCYSFTIYLAHAEEYVGYNKPCRLRVWGGDAPGIKKVLLASSPLVSHTEWKQYNFKFTTQQNINAITFEVYFAPGTSFKYKGNLLLDNCSDIFTCEKA